YRYDAGGHLVGTTDALGHETRYQYDANGNPTRTIYADGSSMTQTFDAANRLIRQTDRTGATWDYQLDAEGNLLSVIEPAVPDPDQGDALARPTYQYLYDSFGNVEQQKDPLGNITSFAFDDQGRQLSETRPGGRTATNTYDSSGRLAKRADFK